MLSCREFIDFLMEFVNGELEPARRRLFLRHIAGCRDCATYLETYRTTVALGRRVCSEREEAIRGESVPDELIRSILAARRIFIGRVVHTLLGIAAGPLLAFLAS